MGTGTFEGYLEAVEPFQARGWAYDRAAPGRVLQIELLLNDVSLGSASADLYRGDLETSGVGAGNHAFIVNFARRLDVADVADVVARVVQADGSVVLLGHLMSVPDAVQAVRRVLTFDELVSDETQRPVFVLGAARSGTSAMAQALLKIGRFEGQQEGHLLDLLAHWSVSLERFYQEKADDVSGDRDTMVSLVPQSCFDQMLEEIFIKVTQRLFPRGHWVDKTPNSNMVHLAPRFLKMWPNAKFIFMRRRFLENAASRSRKFPGYEFQKNCKEWSLAMDAWRGVRGQLRGAAVEVDQRFLDQNPQAAAAVLQSRLDLTDVETGRLAQAFKFDRPERTSDSEAATCDITSLGWQPGELEAFQRICGPAMEAYGYSIDAAYYRPGCEGNGLVIV